MAAHDLINAAVKANESAMRTAIKNGYPVQLPANQYLPKAMNGNVDIIHLGQFADLDAGFDDYRKQQAAQQAQAASQDFSDLDAGFAEWSAAQGGPSVESMRISPVEAPRTASTSTGGQSTGSRSGRAFTGRGTAQEEIPSLDNMAVPVTAKTTTKTVTKAEKTAAKEAKQANSTLSKADKALQTAQKKQTVAEKNLRKKLDKSEAEAQKADAMQRAAKVTKRGNTTVIEPAQNVQQTKRKMQGLAKEEARAQAEYTKAQEDVRKAEMTARKAADRQQAANDRAQAVSAFAARKQAQKQTAPAAEQVTNNAVRRDIIGQSVANQISSYNAMPKASAVSGTSGRVHSGSGRGFVPDESSVVQELIPTLDASVQNLVPTLDVNERIQQRQAEAREATSGRPAASTNTTTPEMDLMQSAVRADALRPQSESSRRLSYLSYLSDPNRRLTKEEQAEAEQIIRDYNREHGIHGGIEGWYDGPNDPQSPEYQEYAAVQRLKAKTTGGAIGSGISDAYNLFNGLLPEGAAKLADFVTGDPNNSFSQSVRQANDLRDQTMQASQVQAPLAYAGGNMAGKMSQYAATNGLFDSIATGKLGLEAGSEAAFWANQLAQNAQDWALNEIPDYIQNRQNGMSREEALRNFGREALIDAGGNVTMGALGDYVIPSLINRFGRGAAESAGDAARAVSNTPAPVDDSVDATLYGTGIMQDLRGADIPALEEADDYILGSIGRQADDVADAVKAAPEAPARAMAEDAGIPEQADEVLNVGAEEIPSATRQAAEATPATAPESIPELEPEEVTPPDNWQALFDEPAMAKSAEEAVDNGIPALAEEAEEAAEDAFKLSKESADELQAEVKKLRKSFIVKTKYIHDQNNEYALAFLDTFDRFSKDPTPETYAEARAALYEYIDHSNTARKNGVNGWYDAHFDDQGPFTKVQFVKSFNELAEKYGFNKPVSDATKEIPILGKTADEVADTANHANRSNNVTMTEEELDEAIADTPPLGPKVDPVERLREKLGQQTNESREYIGRARTNTMARSGIDDLYEQEEVIPEKLFTVMSTPERMSVDNAYGRATNNKEAELERFGKNILTKEEIGGIGGEDVDTMFILRNMLNKQAEAATDEAVKADLYARSRIIALNLNNVAHRGGETVQSFSKWTRTFDGMMTVAEGRLQRQISDVLENNPHMKAEIDTMAHKIFDRIGELDNGEDLRTQVHDIVREVLGDSKYLKGKVDDSTITKLTDSLLKEKSFTNLQDQLDYLATGYHPISPETLDRVQELFDEMDQFNYDSKEYFKREQEVYRLLANEIYAKGGSFRDKFDQWRYFAMLANPTTHLKNIMGNILFGQGAVSTKNGLAALIEEGADRVSKATGGKGIKRTKALLNPKADADLIAAARQDGLENAYRELAGTSRYMDMATGVERVKPAFNPNSKIGSKINRAMDINNRALSGEDELAMIAKYQTSLAGYLKANGKTADIFNATDKESLQFLEDARAYAIRQAEEAAFHQDSVFAKNFSQFTRNLRESESELSKGVGTLMDVAVPFKKTPINILKTCFSYSPLGLARVAKDTYRVAKGTMSGAEMIDDLSKVLTGTAGIAAGALLAHLGIVQSGMGRGEKEQTFDKTTGRQSNAIRIGKSSIGLAELVPAAAPIIYGAIIYDARRMDGEEGNNALDNIVNGLSGVAEATTDMTMLSGFSDILADARSAQGKAEAFKNIGGGLVGNLVGQMFPTVGRKAEITIDDTKRSTYSEKSGSMKNIDSTRKYLQTKIPGSQALGEKLEESEIPALQAIGDQLTLEPAINAWGQEIKQTGGNVLGRAAYNFLSPVTLSTVSDDPVDQELYALGDATGADEIHHTMPQSDANYTDADGNKAKLSEKQWTQYQIENGTRAHEILDQLFQSDAYKSMSDGDKVDAIKRVYSYTKDYALNKVGGKVMNSSTAKLQAAYEEGGVEGVIGELTYLNDLNAAKAETGMDISNNAKAREVYAQFGQEGLTDYKMLGSQFDEIKAAREAVLGKGSTNVDIMSNLTLLNENPDKEDLIIGALVKNPDKYEKTSNGWVYHKGDSVIQADDIKPGNTEGTIPQLESGTTEAPAEINPATGRPAAPTRQTTQTTQAEPAVEIDPRTGRPKAPSRSNEVIQPQGEIPKLEPNGNATWSNDWEIEGSKSWQRFKAIDSSFTTQDYARVYNAMDKDRSGKVKKDEIVAYLDRQSMDDAYKAALYDAFARAGSDNPYKKK